MATPSQPGFSQHYAAVTPSNSTVFDAPSNIRAGGAGTVHFLTMHDEEGTVTLTDGEWLGCQVVKVFADSTATNISRYW